MPKPRRDTGFTLIELLVAISLLCALMAIAVSGWASWSKARQQSGTVSELTATLRQTQQRAVTEGTAMCVTFTNITYTVSRGSCTSSAPLAADRVQGPVPAGRGVQIASDAFPVGVTFTARGTSTDGSVTVTRTGSSKVYTLKVEGFTGRVSVV